MRRGLLCLLLAGVGCSREAPVPVDDSIRAGKAAASVGAAPRVSGLRPPPPDAFSAGSGWPRQGSPVPRHAQRGAPNAADIRPLRPPPD